MTPVEHLAKLPSEVIGHAFFGTDEAGTIRRERDEDKPWTYVVKLEVLLTKLALAARMGRHFKPPLRIYVHPDVAEAVRLQRERA